MLSVRQKITDLIRHIVSCFFPVINGKVFFDSLPDYSDSSRVMSDYVLNDSHYKVFWAVNQIPTYSVNKAVRFVLKKNKLSYWYHTVTAQYIFATHASHVWANPHRQMSVCLWHGTPIKKIGRMQYSNTTGMLRQFRYIISSSEYYVPILKKCFDEEREILVTGRPSNDLLFIENNSMKKLNIDKRSDEKLIVYLPTFRQTMASGNKDSIKDVLMEDFIDFSDKDKMIEWNSFFIDNNIKLIVKPHPADKNQLTDVSLSNIYVVTNGKMQSLDIQLNELLHYADALITDYSSVFCDYMLLDRPIGFMITDLEDYSEKRGFILNPIIDYLPGSRISSRSEFESFCKNVAEGVDNNKELRDMLYHIYNDFHDNNNCKRVAEAIGLKFF